MTEEQTEKISHKDGPPWENVRIFSSFQEADVLRKNLQQDTTNQVKVKKQTNAIGVETFIVKKRKDPTLETEVAPTKDKKKNKKF